MAAAFPIIMQRNYGNAGRAGLVLAAAVLFPALVAFWFARRGKYHAAVQATVVQGLVLVLAVTQFGFPSLAAYHSTRAIAGQALAADAGGEPIVTYCFFQHTLYYYTDYRLGANITDPQSLTDFARRQARFLVVTEAPRVPDLERMPQLSVTPLGKQGKLRLLLITWIRQ